MGGPKDVRGFGQAAVGDEFVDAPMPVPDDLPGHVDVFNPRSFHDLRGHHVRMVLLGQRVVVGLASLG